MKNYKIIISLAIVAISIVLTGCTKEANPDPSPTDARSAFLGRWTVNEIWTKLTYEVNITADPGSNDGVFISNFANTGSSGIPAGATIAGTSIVLDANQVIDGIKINGSGNLSGTKIIWNYTLDDGADIIHATATYTKQ